MRCAIASCLIALLLAGCQPAPMNAEFSSVQGLVRTRTGQQIRWNPDHAEDRAVEATVDQMLSTELSIDQVVQIALLNSPSLQAEYARLGISQADLVQAGLLKNPVFDASIRFPDKSPRGPNVELSITQEFIDLLMIPARQEIAATQLERARFEVSHAVIEYAADVRAAYYSLSGAQQMLQLRETALDAQGLSVETAQRMRDAGNLNDLSLADHQVAYEQAQTDLDDARAQVQQDRERLASLMNLGAAQTFSIQQKLPDPVIDPDSRELVSLALSQRLDLLADRRAWTAAELTASFTRSTAFLSWVQIGADTEREPSGQRVTGPTFSLPIPLFDSGHAAIQRASAEAMRAEQQSRALERQIQAEVRTAVTKMEASRARALRYRTRIIPLRHKIVDEAQLHYNGMLLDVLNLLQARQNEIDAGRDYIATLRDYWIARVELERAVGGSLPESQQPHQAGE